MPECLLPPPGCARDRPRSPPPLWRPPARSAPSARRPARRPVRDTCRLYSPEPPGADRFKSSPSLAPIDLAWQPEGELWKGIEQKHADEDENDVRHDPDRKSTRLNSSHVAISYAVV